MTTRALIIAFGLVVLALAMMLPSEALASKAVAQQENLPCTSCHDKPGSKLLTDQGKYYELMGSLVGFDQIEAKFEKCTTCHVRKPGSKKLTKTGQRYQWVAQDMEGLKQWLMEQHPVPPEEPDKGEEKE